MTKRRLLNRAIRDQSAAIYAATKCAGLSAQLRYGGRHVKVEILDLGGGVHRIPISGSPTCKEASIEEAGKQARRLVDRLRAKGLAR